MTSEQLQSARAERWRQVSNPVVTAEDTRAWLEGVGLCLFLPRKSRAWGAAQAGLGFAPAPSFVEAVAGAPSEAPTRELVENATALLHRLTAEGAIAPLNLFGGNHFGAGGASATGAAVGVAMGVDTPDFAVTREALPYVFSLIGGRNWKSGPGGKASPLMTEIWTLLNDGEPRTAQEIQAALGRELTEAAVLRALVELWNGLRVIPVYGEQTRWELTQAKFAAEMTASQKVAQVTALSALVSLYLESVVAASSEDVETFLSPLASRSRVREVVNGLLATRQLTLVSVGAQPLVHVTGMLPEFAPEPAAEAKPAEEQREYVRPAFENRRPFEKRAPREERKDFRREKRDERSRPFERGRERRASERGGHEEGRERRTFERGGRPSADRGGRRGGRPEDRGQRRERPTDRPERGPERGNERPYRKPFDRERRGEGGERRPFGKKPFEKKFEPRRPGGPERFEGGREGGKFPPKRFGQRAERGERREFEQTARGERPFKPRDGERPFKPRSGEQRPGKESGPGWKPKERRGGFGKQGRPEFRRTNSRSFERPGDREEREPDRQGRPPFKTGGKAGVGGKRFAGRGVGKGGPGAGSGRSARPGKPAKPFGQSRKPFGKSGKPGFGGPKRAGKQGGVKGGFKPPFRKRKKDEGGGE